MANKKSRSAAKKGPNMKIILIVVGVLLLLGLISSMSKKDEPAAVSTRAPRITAAPTVEPMPTAVITDAPTPAPTEIPTLKKGSKGQDVKALQERLIELGYLSGSADGDFGAKTEQAVKDFQLLTHMTQDGVAGPETIRALYYWGAKRNRTVYMTSTGTIYHFFSTCSGMKSPRSMTQVEAVRHGLSLCEKCGY